MNALAPVAPKLAPLLRLLASDNDGEALAAARAIGRVLAGAGLDHHALAAALADPSPTDPAGASPAATMLRDLRARRACLTHYERRFIGDLIGRLAVEGDLRLSHRQRRLLRELHCRIVERAE
jgi:hypothetical protein